MGDQGREGAIGPGQVLTLAAGGGRVEVRGGGDGAATVATVERGHRDAVLRLAGAPPLGWRRTGPGHRWAVDGHGGTLLRLIAAQGLLRSVRITVERAMPEPAGPLLCLLGGFLALRELQAEVDASAAVGGAVAAGAG